MENNQTNPAEPIPPATHSVSLYGSSDALDDFPVLKAFQQYVDAEQAKAHKRLMTVCVFFTILMTIVISVFLFIIFALNRTGGKDDSAILALTEANAATQRQMFEQAQRQNEQFLQMMMRQHEQSSSSGAMDPKLQKDYLDAKAEAHRLKIAKEEAERKVAEVVANPPTPNFTMSEKERLEREADVLKREAAVRNAQKKQKAKAAEQAEFDKQLKEKEKHLQLLKLYPEKFSLEARQECEAKVKAAEARTKAAEDEARAAVRQAMSARDQIEEAERAVLAEREKLAKEKAKLEAERELFEKERAKLARSGNRPPSSAETSTPTPSRSSARHNVTKEPNGIDDLDLDIFDAVRPIDDSDQQYETDRRTAAESPNPLQKQVSPRRSATAASGAFDTSAYDIPLE